MKNKILIFMLGCSLSSIAAANPFDGFYAQLSGGGIATDFENKTTFGATGSIFNVTATSDQDETAFAFLGAAGAGYTKVLDNKYYLSVEALAETGNIQSTATSTYSDQVLEFSLLGQTSTRLRYSYGMLFKPGYLIDNRTALYGLIGPKWGSFKVTSTTQFTGLDDDGNVITPMLSNSKTQDTVGLTLGLGLERIITNAFRVALEYSYTNYGSLSSPEPAVAGYTGQDIGPLLSATDSTNTISNHSDISAVTNQLMLKFIYKFYNI